MDLPSKQRDVDRLVATGGVGTYKSAKVPGLYLEVIGAGVGRYKVRFEKVGGRARRQQGKHTLGNAKIITIGQAEEAARTFLATLQTTGKDPRGDTSALTVGELFQRWLTTYAQQHRKKWKDDSAFFARHIEQRLARRAVNELSKRALIEVLDDIHLATSGYVVNDAQRLLSAVLNWAEGEAIIDVSPARGIPKRFKETARDRVLSHDELRKLWLALDGVPLRTARAIRLLILLGLRESEVIGARKDEIAGDLWTLPASRIKAQVPHVVALPPLAQQIIADASAAYSTSVWLFPAMFAGRTLRDKPMNRSTTEHEFAALAVKLGMVGADGKPDTGIHDIRRTVATNLAALGVPPDLIGRIQGRGLQSGDAGVNWIYNRHTYVAERLDALERWERKLMGIVSSSA